MVFFDRFNTVCKQRGTSPNAVAQKLKISSGTITAWKNGTNPKSTAIADISKYFDISADYFLGLTDMPIPIKENKKKLPTKKELESVKQALEIIIGREPTDKEAEDFFIKQKAEYARINN
jgi:transcriptional regulator with XRE-family HTH domain